MTAHHDSLEDLVVTPRRPGGATPAFETPIVPRNSISGRALIAVVAIMTFLASLTIGAVLLVHASADRWQADIAREITVQVRPMPGRNLDADVAKTVDLLKNAAGISAVRAMSKEESARLLEPWLGTGLTLDQLPVPRMITLTLGAGANPDLAQMRRALADVPGASLDDHRGWVERMRVMAGTAVVVGVAVLILMLAATVLSVSFATRGAMAANRAVIEVLHFVGAQNRFIAGHFQRHFLQLGLQGGAIGGGAAIVLFALGNLIGAFFGDTSSTLFGSVSIGIAGYVAVVVQVVLIAVVTAWTSRHTVNRTLEAID